MTPARSGRNFVNREQRQNAGRKKPGYKNAAGRFCEPYGGKPYADRVVRLDWGAGYLAFATIDSKGL